MRKEVIVHQDPKSPISEIFRTLRTNIQFMNTKKNLKTILITSTLPGEGKSWVSANLAVGFAQTGKKVVLIDADMRKGRQYSIFGVSPRPGLSNYLSGIDVTDEGKPSEDLIDYIQETDVKNLYLMAAGNIPPNPSELLISPQMVDLLEQLKEICDIIIIDGTPSQLVADSLILTRLVDSTILVTASKQTKKDDLRRIITNIQNVGGKISGVVLNKVPVSSKRYQQSYYYGSTNMGQSRKMPPANRKPNFNNNNNIKRNHEIQNQKHKINISNATGEVKTKSQEQTLDRKIKVEGANEASLEKTNDILKQINQYLDQEKKKLQ